MDDDDGGFESHPGRGRFNAVFFRGMDAYIDWHLHKHKTPVFDHLPTTVVELGPGVGANLRYLTPGTRLLAIEPNPYMHSSLRRAAARHKVEVEIRSVVGERIDLPDHSAEAVISSLVLCTVRDLQPWSPRYAGSSGRAATTALWNTSPRRPELRPAGFSTVSVAPGPGCLKDALASGIWQPSLGRLDSRRSRSHHIGFTHRSCRSTRIFAGRAIS